MFKDYANVLPTACFDYESIDSVSDLSSFRPDSEAVRSLKFTAQGDSTSPVYDYPDGVVDDKDTVTDTLIAIRSGRLDKADVDQLKQSIKDNAESKKNSDRSEKLLSAVEKSLGIDSASKTE